MSTPNLEELAALEAAATPAPWEVKRRWSNGCEIIPRITCKPDDDRGCGWIADLIGAPYLGHESTLPNAELIAAARNSLRTLIERAKLAERYEGALTTILTLTEGTLPGVEYIARTALEGK
jgi:hypothetical protein